jgi:sphingosine kinase
MGLPHCEPQEWRYSFLSLTWGLVADIDIESERCRCCGAARFTCEGICKICNLRTYEGSLFYRERPRSSGSGPAEEEEEEKRVDGPFTVFLASNTTHIATDSHLAPSAQLSDGRVDLMLVRKIGRCALLNMFLDLETGEHLKNPHVEYFKASSFRLVPDKCLDGCCCCCSLFCGCCCPAAQPEGGQCVVDGEEVVYTGMEAEVLPGRVNVLSLQRLSTLSN